MMKLFNNNPVKKVLGLAVLLAASFCVFSRSKNNVQGGADGTPVDFSSAQGEKSEKKYEIISDEGAFQSKTVENTAGDIKLLLKGSVGSFQFYSVSGDNPPVPVLAGYDEFTSSFFALKAGKKDFKLTNNTGIVIGSRKSGNGAQMVYVIPEVARVFVKYECLQAIPDGETDILKVTAVVKNRGRKTNTFALKNVLDTVLGEQKGPHFTTADNQQINSEVQFRKFDTVKWLYSGNAKAGIQIMLYGADITPPEVVSVSNKDILSLQNWVPSVVRSRTFDSVLSYNNSALCINWREVTLKPDEEASFTYYIAFSDGKNRPEGETFIARLEELLKPEPVIDEAENKTGFFDAAFEKICALYNAGEYEKALESAENLYRNPECRNESLTALLSAIKEKLDDSRADQLEKQKIPAPEILLDEEGHEYISAGKEKTGNVIDEERKPTPLPDFESSKTNAQNQNINPSFDSGSDKTLQTQKIPDDVKFDVDSIGNEKLNYQYIQGLLDRINALEAEDDSVDRGEIQRLNVELDAILKKLRGM